MVCVYISILTAQTLDHLEVGLTHRHLTVWLGEASSSVITNHFLPLCMPALDDFIIFKRLGYLGNLHRSNALKLISNKACLRTHLK